MRPKHKTVDEITLEDLENPYLYIFTRRIYDFWKIEGGGLVMVDTQAGRIVEYDEAMKILEGLNLFYNKYSKEAIEEYIQRIDEQRDKEIEEYEAQTTAKDTKRTKPEQPGWVYIVRSHGRYKIGHSKNLAGRISTLNASVPDGITLIHTIKCADRIQQEAELHEHFADKRLNGEWFDLNEADLVYIKSLK